MGTNAEIAKILKRNPTTIPREIKRNGTQIRKARYRVHRA
ncbi:MAG: helix-turn-helix domain-containing protein [Spirochaetota bacterium]